MSFARRAGISINDLVVLRNLFTVALRNLRKHRTYSSLNIFGLAVGMTSFLLIFLWVGEERNVDAFHIAGTRLYAVYERQYYDGKVDAGYFTPGPLGAGLKKVIPEIAYASGFSERDANSFSVGDKIVKEQGSYADSDFFVMFSYPLLQGAAAGALNSPVSIAISRKMAADFFGSPEAAMGKTVKYGDKAAFTVTAVFENTGSNSSYTFDYVINWQTFLDLNGWVKEWYNNGPRTFIELREDADPALVAKKITHFLDGYNKRQNAGFSIQLGMQRYDEAYLHSNFRDGRPEGGRITYIRLFSIVGIFILLIACINFMNLATAISVQRAKEIGIRKVIGAARSRLVGQFMGEAILLSIFSAVAAMVLLIALLPAFNSLTGKQITFPYREGSFWLAIVLLPLVTGVVSGCYPALYLSAFRPVRVLKGIVKFSTGATWFRKGLVIFQFTLSIGLIIGTIVISQQMDYMQGINLGYDRENLVYIPLEGSLLNRYSLFRERAIRLPGVAGVTRITQPPTTIEDDGNDVEWEGKDPNARPMFTNASVGYDFVKTMKLQMVAGRDFSKDIATDSTGYLVNEVALKKIGYKDPIGKPLSFWQRKGRIIGVVRDFHFHSLRVPIEPLIIRYGENDTWGYALVRTEAGMNRQALAGLEALCRGLNPEFAFSYRFADDEYQKLYKSEMVVHSLSNCFAFLGIFVSCLGLLGLAMFTAEQRTRELGIRKVLGAGVSSLFTLLTKDFLVLVFIANLIASPLAWWAMYEWLQNFSFHIAMRWWVLVLAGILALLIALLTVSVQAMKVAVANPVSSLRPE